MSFIYWVEAILQSSNRYELHSWMFSLPAVDYV